MEKKYNSSSKVQWSSICKNGSIVTDSRCLMPCSFSHPPHLPHSPLVPLSCWKICCFLTGHLSLLSSFFVVSGRVNGATLEQRALPITDVPSGGPDKPLWESGGCFPKRKHLFLELLHRKQWADLGFKWFTIHWKNVEKFKCKIERRKMYTHMYNMEQALVNDLRIIPL